MRRPRGRCEDRAGHCPSDAVRESPAQTDGQTIGLWSFDDLKESAAAISARVEDPLLRASLPEFQVIAAAATQELTAANGYPKDFSTWHRSHGGASNSRFSSAAQIGP